MTNTAFAEIAHARHVLADALHALLRERRSIRHYLSRKPEEAALNRIFESVRFSPSAHNRQPWRFATTSDDAVKARIARAMGARLAVDRGRDGDAPEAIAADVHRSFGRIAAAPLIIIVALSMSEMDFYPDERRAWAEYLMAVQGTAMAAQTLMLAAHAEGLGTCWMCGPLFCSDAVHSVLDLPADWQLQGLVTLGHAAQPGRPRKRKLLPQFLRRACGRNADSVAAA